MARYDTWVILVTKPASINQAT